jgi:microcystin-dependent protein
MGGTSANRLTNQSGGLNGDTLGAMGGSETHTLTEAQLPTITPAEHQ